MSALTKELNKSTPSRPERPDKGRTRQGGTQRAQEQANKQPTPPPGKDERLLCFLGVTIGVPVQVKVSAVQHTSSYQCLS